MFLKIREIRNPQKFLVAHVVASLSRTAERNNPNLFILLYNQNKDHSARKNLFLCPIVYTEKNCVRARSIICALSI